MPIAYFLRNSLSGCEKANIKECLLKLDDVSITVVSMTCDGLASYSSMIECDLKRRANVTPWLAYYTSKQLNVCGKLGKRYTEWQRQKNTKVQVVAQTSRRAADDDEWSMKK